MALLQQYQAMQQQMLSMPPERAMLVSTALSLHQQTLTRSRKLSPAEVWQRGKPQLTRITPWQWNLIMPARMAHKVHVAPHREITISVGTSCASSEREKLRYDARCQSATGRDVMLRPGDEVLVYVNPHKLDVALCCDTSGAAIGLLHRIHVGTRLDLDAIHRRMGEVRQMTADIEKPIATRAEPLATERQAMNVHNERVVKGLPVTEDEHRAASERKKHARAAAAVFEADPVGTRFAASEEVTDEAQFVPTHDHEDDHDEEPPAVAAASFFDTPSKTRHDD